MPDTLGPINPAGDFPAIKSPGSDIASASTINFQTAAEKGVRHRITGTTNISAVTLAEGNRVEALFAGVLTLVHSANLLLPGGVNIITAAGDLAEFIGEAGSVVRVKYFPADGSTPAVLPLAKGGTGATNAAAARASLALGNAATRNVDVANGVAGTDSEGNVSAGVRALSGTPAELVTTVLKNAELAIARRDTRPGRVRMFVGKSDGTPEGILAGPEFNAFFSASFANTSGTSRSNQTFLEWDPVLKLAAPPDVACRLHAEMWCITGPANTGQGGTIPTISFRISGFAVGFVGVAEVVLNAPNALNTWGTGTRYLMRLSGAAQTITLPQPENGWTNRAFIRIHGIGRTANAGRTVVGIEWAQSIADATAAVVLNNSWLALDVQQIITLEGLLVTLSNTSPTTSDTLIANVRVASEGPTTGTYQWTVNGTDVSGATSRTFSLSGRASGDVVNCRFTASAAEPFTPLVATAATPAIVV